MRSSRTSSPRASSRASSRPIAGVAAVAAIGLLVAACSSSGSPAGTSAASSTVDVTTLPLTTSAATTAGNSTTSAGEASTSTVAAAPTFPLTGMPLTDPTAATRPAVVVKVGNYDAHPQRGSSKADLIYEEIINANVSRFAFVFQSQAAPEVGPIRSGRRQDVNLFGSLNRPVFAWAGGNATVTKEIQSSDLIDLSQFKCQGSCYRTHDDSPVEFTLMFNVQKVFGLSLPNAGAARPQFTYLAAGQAAGGVPSSGVTLKMESYNVDWTWNAATGQYLRVQNGKPDRDKDGTQMTTNNVVVLAMNYLPGISGSPDAVSTGTGEAFVYTGGHYIHGTWSRADRLQPFTLKDDSGKVIPLTPGRTFIELPRPGNTTSKG